MDRTDCPISLCVAADPTYARLVRMTAANVAMLSSMSVDKVEDLRMAAEEAFIYACATTPKEKLTICFDVDAQHAAMDVVLPCEAFGELDAADPANYADVILSTVCDDFSKTESPATLHLSIRADV